MTKTYPISLVLTGKAVLVVGGGEVAARKVKGLLDCETRITVVSPQLTSELRQLSGQGACLWLEKTYDTSDLESVDLVFACTDAEDLNARISQDATERQLLVNVADRPDLCTFFLPSVLRRNSLSIAVSTDGSSPLTARLIRESLEKHVDDEIGEYLELLRTWRPQVLATLPAEKRKRFWLEAHSGQIYEFVKLGQHEQAQDELTRLFEKLSKEE